MTFDLRRGQFVKALRDLDPAGADVKKDQRGVCVERAGYHEENSGPLVKWETGCTCNVYEGDVEPLAGVLFAYAEE